MKTAYFLLPLIDFALLILAWLVQLIIYPSFQEVEEKKFHTWHIRYKKLIGVFVIPLMLSQLSLSIFLSVISIQSLYILHSVFILLVWLSTFFQAVPIHNALEKNAYDKTKVRSLVKANLPRTILWTICFIISLLQFYKNIQMNLA